MGRSFELTTGPDRNVPIQVVGVARDSKYARLEQHAPPTLFMPHAQLPASAMTVEVRTASDPMALASAIREAVARSDPAIALAEMKTERRQIAETIGKPRALAALTAVAGTIGLLLACVGLYGVVSYETARRTQEIGIRTALGATRADVLRLVMRQTVVVLGIGSTVGLLLALAASRLIGSLLFGIAPTDPLAIGSALAVLISVALAASYLPARRAARLDPTQALRYRVDPGPCNLWILSALALLLPLVSRTLAFQFALHQLQLLALGGVDLRIREVQLLERIDHRAGDDDAA